MKEFVINAAETPVQKGSSQQDPTNMQQNNDDSVSIDAEADIPREKSVEMVKRRYSPRRDVSESRGGNTIEFATLSLFIAGFVLTVVVGILGLMYFSKQKNQEKEDVLGTTEPELEYKKDLEDSFVYTDGFNIFQARDFGDDVRQLTDYKDEKEYKIGSMQVIDNEHIGYFKCGSDSEDTGCKIYKVVVPTEEVILVRTIDKSLKLSRLAWADLSTYAYTTVNSNGTSVNIEYVHDNNVKKIERFPPNVKGDRGIFIEDSSKLIFSPEKDRLAYIDTTAGRGFNFTVYIYDVNGGIVDKIVDATMPVWKDKDTIIYRRYANNDAGYLYKRDLVKKESSRITYSHEASYDPVIQGNFLVWWEMGGSGNTYVYDVTKSKGELLEQGSAYPVWIGKNEIMYAKTRECGQEECMDPGTIDLETQFLVEDYYVKNLTTREVIKVVVNSGDLQNGVISLYTRFLTRDRAFDSL